MIAFTYYWADAPLTGHSSGTWNISYKNKLYYLAISCGFCGQTFAEHPVLNIVEIIDEQHEAN